jgi:mono/diheme cytochrome c family protein
VSRRAIVALVAAVGAIAVLALALAWLLDGPRPRQAATRGERLWVAYCAHCHGEDGKGSWRATLFLIRPGDLTEPSTRASTDRYLFDIIKHGGSPIGRPGMPGFQHLSDEDIQTLVRYLRALSEPRRVSAGRRSAHPVDPQ